jgi:hypothetical protein
LHLFDANIFFPQPRALLLSDAVLLQGLAALPFLKLGVPVVLVSNLLIFAGFVTSALGAFLLVRDLTGRAAPAVLAGVVFAFAPFRFDHYFHLEMSWAQWMPLTFWMLHRTVKTGQWRHGLLTGVFFALQAYSSVYYTVFLAGGVAIASPFVLWTAERRMRSRAIRSLAAGALLAGALVAPYVATYRAAAAETGGRSRQEALTGYGAGPKHYLATMPSSLVYGHSTGRWGQHEKRLFPGFVVMALVGLALWPPLNRRRLAYALVLAFTIDISFAGRGLLLGWLYDYVFAFRGLRVPPRIGQLMLLSAGVLAALGLTRLTDRLRGPRQQWAAAAGVAAIVLTSVEYLNRPMPLVPVPTSPSPVMAWIASQPRGVVAELPAPGPITEGIPEVYYQFASISHWHPLLGGYSGMYPAEYVKWTQEMSAFPSETAIAGLRARGATYIVLHERYYAPGQYRQIVEALARRDDLLAFGPFPEAGGEARAYRLLGPGKH